MVTSDGSLQVRSVALAAGLVLGDAAADAEASGTTVRGELLGHLFLDDGLHGAAADGAESGQLRLQRLHPPLQLVGARAGRPVGGAGAGGVGVVRRPALSALEVVARLVGQELERAAAELDRAEVHGVAARVGSCCRGGSRSGGGGDGLADGGALEDLSGDGVELHRLLALERLLLPCATNSRMR